ncbi:hypothetical protein ACVIYL_003087 [Bradyrhizobium sp. USDA 3315]
MHRVHPNWLSGGFAQRRERMISVGFVWLVA